jgi:pimeloyl-ACP methyl ester carboxylesterase
MTKTATHDATQAPTQFATTSNATLAYRSVGDGPPLILCNRFRGTLDDWDPKFLNALAAAFTVITFDYRGVGRSTGPAPSSVAAMAQDAKDLADALAITKFAIVGWSMGGVAAQASVALWAQSLTHVIAIGAAPLGPLQHGPDPLFLKIAAKPELDLEDEIQVFFEPRSEASRLAAKQSHDRIAQRTADRDPPVKPDVFMQILQNVAADRQNDPYDVRAALHTTSTPILVLSGDRDICFPVENWYALSGKVPMQHVVFPHAGHGPQHQYPDLAADYIRAFVLRQR